ncbi:NrsF family protein [Acidovorax cavernicola]|uniref:DUF1109 domain-containing protein n=1 Tax=Acidovorax cavernicola TaxID=1675792 RepID=A0A9X8GU95_9BURK|nr:DUF1109 domain-containing protein [Acidovorax cavernicola]RIX77717.1 DUF1109 domain-containing protein [Acidovorax cavernicola]
MKTDELVSLLAADVTPVRQHATTRHLGLALGAGLLVSLLIVTLGYGLRTDLALVVFWPAFWIKLVFLVALGWSGFFITHRLARPGVRAGAAMLGFALPLAALWLAALATWLQAAPPERMPLLLGDTWKSCIFSILLVSAPMVATALAALRTLAPTRPALAGAAVGAMAGGAGAAVYALHCPELALPFLAVWYVGGVAATIAISAALGARLLRW